MYNALLEILDNNHKLRVLKMAEAATGGESPTIGATDKGIVEWEIGALLRIIDIYLTAQALVSVGNLSTKAISPLVSKLASRTAGRIRTALEAALAIPIGCVIVYFFLGFWNMVTQYFSCVRSDSCTGGTINQWFLYIVKLLMLVVCDYNVFVNLCLQTPFFVIVGSLQGVEFLCDQGYDIWGWIAPYWSQKIWLNSEQKGENKTAEMEGPSSSTARVVSEPVVGIAEKDEDKVDSEQRGDNKTAEMEGPSSTASAASEPTSSTAAENPDYIQSPGTPVDSAGRGRRRKNKNTPGSPNGRPRTRRFTREQTPGTPNKIPIVDTMKK